MNQAGILVTVVYWHYEAIVLTAESETAAKHIGETMWQQGEGDWKVPSGFEISEVLAEPYVAAEPYEKDT